MAAFPDGNLANQWPTLGEEETQATMAARIDANFNLLVPRVLDSGYTTATLGNSWVAFGSGLATPSYRLKNGFVYCHGMMMSGTTNTTIFTLPVGMRPLAKVSFSVLANGGTARIDIASTGTVVLIQYNGGANNAYVSLDGLIFVAEQ